MANATPHLDTIFSQAIEIADPNDRMAYLKQACGENDALRNRLEALVAAHFRAGSFLNLPDQATQSTGLYRPSSDSLEDTRIELGTKIGPYKLLECIGEGGMGIVYVAEQTEPVRRKVALKVIKPGMDTKEVVARFEQERQALALMDHPNIARVLDAGSTNSGLPYFVMELVRGLSVTDYCDQARLSPNHRLRIFSQICRAVQHAHMKGIIHRDIKPSNVLITLHDGEPVPKVIDFGIAKAMHQPLIEKTIYPRLAQLVGTPLYMSPEQAELSGLDIDTRSDVYSLGVLLYELLTGTTPFDRETFRTIGFDEIRRIIREDEPLRPSHRLSTLDASARSTISTKRGLDDRQLSKCLTRDLDWIVMKALEKDRNRRYESGSAFAEDVDRYLADQPIRARPPSMSYSLRKFARRNKSKLLIGSIALVFLSILILGIRYVINDRSIRISIADQKTRESLAVARTWIDSGNLNSARQQAAEAEGHLAAYHTDLADRVTELESLRREISDRQTDLERFQKFVKLAAEAQDRLGYGFYRDGVPIAEEALGLFGILTDDRWTDQLEKTYLTDSQKETVRETAYETLVTFADYQVRAGYILRSLDLLHRAEAFHSPTRAFYFVQSRYYLHRKETKLSQEDQNRYRKIPGKTAWDYYLPGRTEDRNGNLDEAIHSYRSALRIQPDHFNSMFYLAHLLSENKQEYREAIGLYTGCIAVRPSHIFSYTNRAECYQHLGLVEEEESDLDLALRASTTDPALSALMTDDERLFVYHERLKFYRRLHREQQIAAEQERILAQYHRILAANRAKFGPNHEKTRIILNNIGVWYVEAKRFNEGIPLLEESVSGQVRRNPSMARSLANLAQAYWLVNRKQEALKLKAEVVSIFKSERGPENAETLEATNELASAYFLEQNYSLALPLFEELWTKYRTQSKPDPVKTLSVMDHLAECYRYLGKISQAMPLHEESLKKSREFYGFDRANTLRAQNNLGLTYNRAGRIDEALVLLTETLAKRKQLLPPHHKHTQLSMHNLAEVCSEIGQTNQAIALYEELVESYRKILGPDHDETFNVMHALAHEYEAAGRSLKAIALFEKTRTETAKKRGPDHPETWKQIGCLAKALQKMGKREQAEKLIQKVISQ